jgi:hypothetical protein
MAATALPTHPPSLNERLAVESVWADRVARAWSCLKHLALVSLLLVALVGCQSFAASAPEASRWKTARVVATLSADEAAKAGRCGAVASVRVGYYRGSTRFYAVHPAGDPSPSIGQWVRLDRSDPCAAVQASTSP